jgi:hypothetical protein
MSLENLLTWVHTFAAEGGPRTITAGGGFALRNRIAPAAAQLGDLVRAATDETNPKCIPPKLVTPPVGRALGSLAGRLDEVAWNC